MIRIPRGKLKEKTSSTSLDLEAKMAELEGAAFTGCVEIAFTDVVCLLLFREGALVSTTEMTNGRLERASRAELSRRLGRQEGLVSLWAMPTSIVDMLSRLGMGELRYENLSTETTDLDRVLLSIRRQPSVGIIEVQLDGATGYIPFVGGQPTTAGLYLEEDRILSGGAGLRAVLRNCEDQKGTINIYMDKVPAYPDQRDRESLRVCFAAITTALLDTYLRVGGRRLVERLEAEINQMALQNNWNLRVKAGTIEDGLDLANTQELAEAYKQLLMREIEYIKKTTGKRILEHALLETFRRFDKSMQRICERYGLTALHGER